MDKTTGLVTIFSCHTYTFIISLSMPTVYSGYISFVWHADTHLIRIFILKGLKDLLKSPA